MASVFDVAAYILESCDNVTAMKLQKLVYYAQGWSLAWLGEELFEDDIEAWVNGPVVPRLYQAVKGKYLIDHIEKGNPHNLTDDQKEVIDEVIDMYGQFTGDELSEFTHNEDPWISARKDYTDGTRSKEVISKESLSAFFSSLDDKMDDETFKDVSVEELDRQVKEYLTRLTA